MYVIIFMLHGYRFLDEPSLELLDSMISSKVNVLVFVNYRDKEISEKVSGFLNTNASNIHFMKVDALNFESLTDLICDTLHRPRDVGRENVIPLAEAIFKRTNGNCFYTSQLLRTLERKKSIFFNWEKNEWDYNLGEIQQDTTYGTSVSNPTDTLNQSFLIARLRELPRDGQLLLKWASFVGDTFSWSTVKSLMLDSDPEDSVTSSIMSDDATSLCSSNATYDTPKAGVSSIDENNNAGMELIDDIQSATSDINSEIDDNNTLTMASTAITASTQTDNNKSRGDRHRCYHGEKVVSESLHPLTKFSGARQRYENTDSSSRSAHQSSLGKQHRARHSKHKGSPPAPSSVASSSSESTTDPISGLQAVLQEGYIMPTQSDEFKWSHDRISQAAMELANPKTRSKIHFKIAQHLMKGLQNIL